MVCYRSCRSPEPELRGRFRELANGRRRCGKPMQNGHIHSFSGGHDELLNDSLFFGLEHTRDDFAEWVANLDTSRSGPNRNGRRSKCRRIKSQGRFKSGARGRGNSLEPARVHPNAATGRGSTSPNATFRRAEIDALAAVITSCRRQQLYPVGLGAFAGRRASSRRWPYAATAAPGKGQAMRGRGAEIDSRTTMPTILPCVGPI